MMGYAPGVSSKLIDKIVLANPILRSIWKRKDSAKFKFFSLWQMADRAL